MVDVARELGLRPLKVPAAPTMFAARMVSKVPWMPSSLSWVEAMSHPAVMDTTRAKTELGWEPRYTGIEALRDTLR